MFDEINFTMIFNETASLIYFNNSKLLHFIRLINGTDRLSFDKDLKASRTPFKYVSEKYKEKYPKKSTFIKNYYTVCKNDVLKCTSYYFICDSNPNEKVEIDKVCDFNFDCKDLSDEMYCSKKTHFNCSSGFPISISRSKVNDNQVDCSDRSDECKVNPISSAEEIIKSPNLRKYIWFSTLAIIALNIISITKCCNKIKNLDKKHLVRFYNLMFVINLSFSDLIFGFVLATLAFFSNKFSGYYCLNDFKWRSSIGCNVIGMLTIISSQTSLNLLVLMTGFRLYTTYKPFNSLHSFKTKFTFLILICWFVPITISFIPILLHQKFIQSTIVSSNMFQKNKIIDSIVNLGDKLATNRNTQNFEIWFKNIDEMKTQHPNANITVKNTFGFYSSSTVCLPDFYSKSLLASNFSFVLMSFNLILIVLISTGYIFIHYKISSSKVKIVSTNRTEQERKFMVRVSLIVVTDIVCWLPIIVFTYANYFGYQIPDIVVPLSSIVLLPINSFVNPFLYSKVETFLYETSKKCVQVTSIMVTSLIIFLQLF